MGFLFQTHVWLVRFPLINPWTQLLRKKGLVSEKKKVSQDSISEPERHRYPSSGHTTCQPAPRYWQFAGLADRRSYSSTGFLLWWNTAFCPGRSSTRRQGSRATGRDLQRAETLPWSCACAHSILWSLPAPLGHRHKPKKKKNSLKQQVTPLPSNFHY